MSGPAPILMFSDRLHFPGGLLFQDGWIFYSISISLGFPGVKIKRGIQFSAKQGEIKAHIFADHRFPRSNRGSPGLVQIQMVSCHHS